ncbi:MAG: hypothetical protein QM775_07140 [Pirellulales bacterium]
MNDHSLETLRRVCLKPDPGRMGTWTARRWGRPAALRVTRVVATWGWSANTATRAACLTAVAACAAACFGGPWSLPAAVGLWHLWYVLDHVDGQLARLRKAASLDGAAWDYLMHHGVNLFLPLSLGFGLQRRTGSSIWMLLGAAWGGGTLLLGLRHDVARYKAFVQRLKRLHGELRVVGGGAERPQPGGLPTASWRRRCAWVVMKTYETHTVIGVLTLIAVAGILSETIGDSLLRIYVALLALPAPWVAVFHIRRMLRQNQAEHEFSAWFRVPEDATLEFRDGWWYVESLGDGTAGISFHTSPANRAASPHDELVRPS